MERKISVQSQMSRNLPSKFLNLFADCKCRCRHYRHLSFSVGYSKNKTPDLLQNVLQVSIIYPAEDVAFCKLLAQYLLCKWRLKFLEWRIVKHRTSYLIFKASVQTWKIKLVLQLILWQHGSTRHRSQRIMHTWPWSQTTGTRKQLSLLGL